ncbi:MAG: L,D-transpeptidase family protein [Minwuia sp.]|uniref:L,D-transpeptidase family protein n=1 Tax=Minwuia sp. TaxID=2493630 RepID=UPI003A8C850B
MRRWILPACLLAAVAIASVAGTARAVEREAVVQELTRRAGAVGMNMPEDADQRPRIESAVLNFYERRGWEPVWVTRGEKEQERLRAAMEVLEAADEEGLRAEDYQLTVTAEELPAFLEDANAAQLAALDATATTQILAYGRDVAVGRRTPQRADPNVFLPARPLDLGAVLERMADPQANIRNVLARLAPQHEAYRRLKIALAVWRGRIVDPVPESVPEGAALKPGETGPRADAVVARLKYWRWLDAGAAAEGLTPTVVAALKDYQKGHGLEEDGIAGKATQNALNAPLAQRIRQIELAMERWRWMADDLGARHVIVDIAGFETMAVRNGKVDLRIRSIVGRDYRMTPVFSDLISYVEINPTWTVPPKIAVKDLLPKIRKDPEFLSKGRYEVWSGWQPDARLVPLESIDWSKVGPGAFPYRLRQGPSLNNALGEVKIMFPNRFDVYLHDSPARELYEKPVRTFSSGCIRLEKPFDLVRWLFDATDGPEPEKVEEYRNSRKTVTLPLDRRIPVHLMYATAWPADSSTGVAFREDVYGRDVLLSKALGLE